MLFQGKIGVGGEGELSPCGGQGGRVKIKPPGLVGGGYIWGTWRGGGPFSHKITAAKEKGRWPSSNFFAASAVTSAMLQSRLLIPKRRAAFYLTSARNCLFFLFPPFFGRARTKKSGTANWPCRRGKGKRETFLVLSSLLRARSPLLSPTLLQALREKKTLLYFATPSTSTLFYLLQVKRVPFLSNSHSWFEEERERKRWGKRRKKVP